VARYQPVRTTASGDTVAVEDRNFGAATNDDGVGKEEHRAGLHMSSSPPPPSSAHPRRLWRRLQGFVERLSSSPSFGLVLLGISSLCYSVMGVFIKLASSREDIPSTQLVLLRSLFQGTIVVLAMTCLSATTTESGIGHQLQRISTSSTPSQQKSSYLLITQPLGTTADLRRLVVLRGIVGAVGFVLYYYTISHLPLGDATALLSLNPIVTVLAAACLLEGESLQWSHVTAACLSVVGSVLIAQPTVIFGTTVSDNETDVSEYGAFGVNNTISSPSTSQANYGYVTAALGTLCGAGVYILIRKAGTSGAHTLQLLFSWSVFGVLFSLGVQLAVGAYNHHHHHHNNNSKDSTDEQRDSEFVLPTSTEGWMYVLGMCVVGTFSHFLMNYAGRICPAGLTSIIRSSGILFAYMWEVLVFGQVPTALTCVGVALILVSVGTVAFEQQQKSSPAAAATAATESGSSNRVPSTTLLQIKKRNSDLMLEDVSEIELERVETSVTEDDSSDSQSSV